MENCFKDWSQSKGSPSVDAVVLVRYTDDVYFYSDQSREQLFMREPQKP